MIGAPVDALVVLLEPGAAPVFVLMRLLDDAAAAASLFSSALGITDSGSRFIEISTGDILLTSPRVLRQSLAFTRSACFQN